MDASRQALRAADCFAYATVDKVHVEDEGVLCDVTLDTGEETVARLLLDFGGDDHGSYTTPAVGQQVLCLLLGGDVNECILLGRLTTTRQPPPAGVGPDTHLYRSRNGQNYDGTTRGDATHRATGTARVEGGAMVELAKTSGPLYPDDGVVTGRCMCLWGGLHVDRSACVRAQKASGSLIGA